MASDVGGMISAKSKKNTVNDTKIEMHRVTWPEKKVKINFKSKLYSKSIETYFFARITWQIEHQNREEC